MCVKRLGSRYEMFHNSGCVYQDLSINNESCKSLCDTDSMFSPVVVVLYENNILEVFFLFPPKMGMF